MLGFWRRNFYSRWFLLDHMQLGKWYYGLDLHKEFGFNLGSLHVKLYYLQQDGFVESRMGESVQYGDVVLRRWQYRATGKRRPERSRNFAFN